MEIESIYTSTQLLEVAAGLRQTLANIERAGTNFPSSHDTIVNDEKLVSVAKRLVSERRVRTSFFSETDFGEPVWDIMLDLYIARMLNRKISVSSACIAAAVPPTTALRYVVALTEDGKIERVPDPNDGRRVYVVLSDECTLAMSKYLTGLAKTAPQ
jgi:hypothetical protein